MATAGKRRPFWIVVGVIAILLGGVWALQGLKVIGGSAMTGVSIWIWVGAAVVVGGVFALFHGLSRRLPK
jgi:hypothetical protein